MTREKTNEPQAPGAGDETGGLWFEFDGRVAAGREEALNALVFAAQYAEDVDSGAGLIAEEDAAEIAAFPSVEDYVATLSPTFAASREAEAVALPLPVYALALLAADPRGRIVIEQEGWVAVDDRALALLLSDFLAPAAVVAVKEHDTGRRWLYRLRGPGAVERVEIPFEDGDRVTTELSGPGVINGGKPRAVLSVEASADCETGWLVTASAELRPGRRPRVLPVGLSRVDAAWFKRAA